MAHASTWVAITSERQLQRIRYYVALDVKEGATLACGRRRISV